MDRRGFLGAMFAAAVAPAFVKAESLMKLAVPSKDIILLNDGIIANGGTGQTDACKALMSLGGDFDGDTIRQYTMKYQRDAARQDEFGEYFFPTVIVHPESVGYPVNLTREEIQRIHRNKTLITPRRGFLGTERLVGLKLPETRRVMPKNSFRRG